MYKYILIFFFAYNCTIRNIDKIFYLFDKIILDNLYF